MLFNLVTVSSPVSIVLTIVEIMIVLGLLSKRHYTDAFFWHTVFSITCVSATNAEGIDFDNTVMYSYSRLKLVGPIGLSYVVSILIMLLTLSKVSSISKQSMFYKLTMLLAFFLTGGFIIGLLGVVFSDYYPQYLLNFSVYTGILLVNCICFIKCYSKELKEKVYRHSAPLLCGACVSSVIAYYLLGVSTTYGGMDDIILVPDVAYYGVILLFLVIVYRKLWVLLGLVAFLTLIFNGVGGKYVVGLIVALVFSMYYVIKRQGSVYSGIIKRKYIFASLGILAIGGVSVLSTIELPDMSAQKFEQAFDLFFMLGDLQNMSTSPYVRVASFLDIMNDGLSNPIFLLFGHGYGGYFTDSLSLLYSKLDMYAPGGFPIEAVVRHQLPTGHDTFVVVPLLNGLVGLFSLIYVVFQYMRKIKYTPYVYAAFLWLLLVFYFNTQLAITGIYFLFAAEYKIIYKHKKVKNSLVSK